jgi:hypothetical protein
VLDRLVGPWLEVIADGFYRVSPLLRDVGLEVQGEAWATAMNAAIGRAILAFRTLSPTDVSTILFHATAAREWLAIAQLSLGLLTSDKETWEALAQSANWFVLVGAGGAMRPETDVFSLSLIRLLQLKLAAADHDNESAASVIACMNEELPATVEGMPLRVARYFLLGQVQLCTEVTLSVAQLVSMGLEFIRLTDELKDVLASVYDPEFDVLEGPDGAPDLAGVAGFTLIPHLTDRHSLTALGGVRTNRHECRASLSVVCWRPRIHSAAHLRSSPAVRVQQRSARLAGLSKSFSARLYVCTISCTTEFSAGSGTGDCASNCREP